MWFADRSYHLITGLYGPGFNGYMGVAIAYPLDVYEALDVRIDRLSDFDASSAVDPTEGRGEIASSATASRGAWPLAPFKEKDNGKKEAANPSLAGLLMAVTDRALKLVLSPFRLLIGGGGGGGEEKPEVFVRGKAGKDDEDIYTTSKKKSNILISATLSHRAAPSAASRKPFQVSTYHMPCAFMTPQLMVLHAELAVRHSMALANRWPATGGIAKSPTGPVPFVLAGDFNFLPDSKMYELATTGKLDASDKAHQPPSVVLDSAGRIVVGGGGVAVATATAAAATGGGGAGKTPTPPSCEAGGPGSATAGSTSKDASLAQQRVYEWKPDIGDGMVSAYCAKLGVEPDFTNYSRVKEDEPFVGTLDYIFLSKGGGEGGKSRWTVTDVERIKHRDDVKGPLPNDDEPSDHVAVRADLTLD